MRIRPISLGRLSPLLLITILSLPLLGTACRSTPDADAAPQAPAVPVQLKTLRSATVRASSEFVGNLEAVEIVKVLPQTQGRIDKILVQPGQKVSVGQSMMVLSPDQTVPQYQEALAGVNVAISKRDNALKSVEVAKANRNTAKATLELLNTNVERVRAVVEEGGLAKFRLDEIVAQQEEAKNKLFAAEKQIAEASEAVKQEELAIFQAKTKAKSSQINVNFLNITSPIAGVVDALPVKVGDYVSAGQNAVATVAQTESLFLNITVPANRSAQLKTGLKVELINPTNKEQLATGNLTFVSPTINTDGQTILTRARFRNVQGKLRDGQNVQSRIIWDTQPGLLIPTTATSRIGNKSFVFVVDDEPNDSGQEVVRLKPIELGEIQGDSYQVVSGLKVGDRIAISNILKLQDGVPVDPAS